MKKTTFITALSILLAPMMAMAQKQYYLPTGSAEMTEKDMTLPIPIIFHRQMLILCILLMVILSSV